MTADERGDVFDHARADLQVPTDLRARSATSMAALPEVVRGAAAGAALVFVVLTVPTLLDGDLTSAPVTVLVLMLATAPGAASGPSPAGCWTADPESSPHHDGEAPLWD